MSLFDPEQIGAGARTFEDQHAGTIANMPYGVTGDQYDAAAVWMRPASMKNSSADLHATAAAPESI